MSDKQNVKGDVERETYWLDETLRRNGPCPHCGTLGMAGALADRAALTPQPAVGGEVERASAIGDATLLANLNYFAELCGDARKGNKFQHVTLAAILKAAHDRLAALTARPSLDEVEVTEVEAYEASRTAIKQLQERAEKAEAQLSAMRELLAVWDKVAGIDDAECRSDHDGYCQAHFMQQNCIAARTRTVLAATSMEDKA